jgi:DNA-binding MarR family transcriptional regulator
LDRSELAIQLTDSIVTSYAAVSRSGDRAFRAYRLSHRAQAILHSVDAGGPDGARPKEIAELLGISRAAATTFVQRLEAKGLVETTPDDDDDRGVRVRLTERGLELMLKVGQLQRRLAARTIEGMPASTIAKTVSFLQDFVQRLEITRLGLLKV